MIAQYWKLFVCFPCKQSPDPKASVVRTHIVSVKLSPGLRHNRTNVFTICTKSRDKWCVSAAEKVRPIHASMWL